MQLKKKKDHGFLINVCEYVKVFLVDITEVIVMFNSFRNWMIVANIKHTEQVIEV